MSRTITQVESMLRRSARALTSGTATLVAAFVKTWATEIEDGYSDESTYEWKTKRGKQEGSAIKLYSYIANEEGVGPEFSKLLRIRKGNRRVWNLYLKGQYVSLDGTYRALLEKSKGSTKKVRLPRALRVRMENIVKTAERQGFRVHFTFSRI